MLETAEPCQTREVFVLCCVELHWRKGESLVITRARWRQKSNAARLLVTIHNKIKEENRDKQWPRERGGKASGSTGLEHKVEVFFLL